MLGGNWRSSSGQKGAGCEVVEMSSAGDAAGSETEAWQEEIERAVDGVNRTRFDRWMRSEWHKAESRRRWSVDRQANWEEWREKRPRGAARGRAGQPEHVPVTESRV